MEPKLSISRKKADNLHEIRFNEAAIQALGYPKELVFYLKSGKPIIEYVLSDTVRKIRAVKEYKFKRMVNSEYRMSIGDITADVTGSYKLLIDNQGISLEKIGDADNEPS